jgi:CheY-like chemotaxis protein
MMRSSSQIRVLVVGTSLSNRKLLATLARASGCVVDEVGACGDVANILQAAPVDLLLVDLTGNIEFDALWPGDLQMPPLVACLVTDVVDLPEALAERAVRLHVPIDPRAIADLVAACGGRTEAKDGLAANTIDDLRRLGGQGFVDDVIAQFLIDAAALLDLLRSAQSEGDAIAFCDHLHALRSGAANIGARSIYEVCIRIRAISAEDVRCNGLVYISQLSTKLDAIRALTGSIRKAA